MNYELLVETYSYKKSTPEGCSGVVVSLLRSFVFKRAKRFVSALAEIEQLDYPEI